MGRTIGVVSLKGGVGKTSAVVCLGHSIAGFGKKVLLVDGNLSAPNLGVHLNLINPGKTLHDVLLRNANPSDAVYRIENVDVLPAGIFRNENVNPLKLKDSLRHLKRSYDFIIIDSSPSLNEETLGAMLASDEIVVVTTPDYPTMSTTLKAVKSARLRGTPISGLILNKVHNKNFEISVGDVEDTLDVPVLAVVPHDINFLRALSKFRSSTELNPNSEASQEFKRLAAALIGEKYKKHKLRNFFKWINPRKQDINRMIYYDGLFR